MCKDCGVAFETLTQSVAATLASWTCSTCGEVRFTKEADPEESPEPPAPPKPPTNVWDAVRGFWSSLADVAQCAAVVLAIAVMCGVFGGGCQGVVKGS